MVVIFSKHRVLKEIEFRIFPYFLTPWVIELTNKNCNYFWSSLGYVGICLRNSHHLPSLSARIGSQVQNFISLIDSVHTGTRIFFQIWNDWQPIVLALRRSNESTRQIWIHLGARSHQIGLTSQMSLSLLQNQIKIGGNFSYFGTLWTSLTLWLFIRISNWWWVDLC